MIWAHPKQFLGILSFDSVSKKLFFHSKPLLLELLSDKKGLVVYGETRSGRGKYLHFVNKHFMIWAHPKQLLAKMEHINLYIALLSLFFYLV